MNVGVSTALWFAIPASVGALLLVGILRGLTSRTTTRRRLYRNTELTEDQPVVHEPDELWQSWLERWLFLAGIRRPNAVSWYLNIQAMALIVGVILLAIVLPLKLRATLQAWLLEIPGGIGNFLAPVMAAAPWMLLFIIALIPISYVRSRRRQIVQSVERDLPMALALLATLAESGLGLDAAVQRVLQALDPERALAKELTIFRSETQGGVPRVLCFRRLGQRVDVSAMSVFVSALIHAEQIGGGIAESLRRQADEVWSRRREFAIQRAQALPTKLAVPLVICFLPGIFVYTFGPALAQFIQIAEGVVRGGE